MKYSRKRKGAYTITCDKTTFLYVVSINLSYDNTKFKTTNKQTNERRVKNLFLLAVFWRQCTLERNWNWFAQIKTINKHSFSNDYFDSLLCVFYPVLYSIILSDYIYGTKYIIIYEEYCPKRRKENTHNTLSQFIYTIFCISICFGQLLSDNENNFSRLYSTLQI